MAKRHIDYAYKSKIMKLGIDKAINNLDKEYFFKDEWDMLDRYNDEQALCDGYCCDRRDLQEGRKINNASYHRTKRLKERIEWMLEKDKGYFITLTFTDDTLNSTSAETRKVYVKRWLKENCFYYVANIDYGSENKREHYHAVVILKDKRMNFKEWHKYGALLSETINTSRSKKTSLKLAKYVDKLTNHAIKETTKRQALIYSRLI